MSANNKLRPTSETPYIRYKAIKSTYEPLSRPSLSKWLEQYNNKLRRPIKQASVYYANGKNALFIASRLFIEFPYLSEDELEASIHEGYEEAKDKKVRAVNDCFG